MNLIILLWQVKCMSKLYIYKSLLSEKKKKKTLKYQAKKEPTYSDSHFKIFVTHISLNEDLSLSLKEHHSVFQVAF